MKEILDQIEEYLVTLIEGNSDRIFNSVAGEKKLIHQVMEALGSSIYTDNQGNLFAPNNFSLNVPFEILEEVRSAQPFIDRLSDNITNAAREAGINFNGKVTITVFPNNELRQGEFTLNAIWKEDALAETAPSMISGTLQALQAVPKAFLIVGGTQIFTLEEDVINIGRQLKNDLVVNDPRVSRKHAQIRVIKGRHILFDLGSSGGTKVNDKPIKQSSLHPGDVITLAGVPLVYGHDAIPTMSDTEEYKPPQRGISSGASTTTKKYSPKDKDPSTG